MTREDVVFVANMLHHADVVITPGSTMTLEAAIFDTPTLVPIFHVYQPEMASNYFASVGFSKHLGRLERLDLVPIIRTAEELGPAINQCLANPSWYKVQRSQLVRDYVHFTDGRSVERLSKLIVQLATA
jgi:CDP-glycerol glycerophosphotransferase (TagB/SpsB family)